MTVSNGRIDDFVAGDDLEVERMITAIPEGITITTAWLMVKRKYTDSDVKAIISKTITSNNTAGIGWIEDTGATGEGTLRFYLTPEDTALLNPLSEYPYSIKIKLSNGIVNTPEVGIITSIPAVKQGSI